jgi:hypothetical protein
MRKDPQKNVLHYFIRFGQRESTIPDNPAYQRDVTVVDLARSFALASERLTHQFRIGPHQ